MRTSAHAHSLKVDALPKNLSYLFHNCFVPGPDEWETLNANWSCNGRKQSPIDIQTDQVIPENPNPSNIRVVVEPKGSPITGELVNNGHAPTFYVAEELTVRLTGGGLRQEYFLKKFYFHFGCDNTVGSEHSIDSNKYPVEVRCIHYL